MAILLGKRLGPYEILSAIGAMKDCSAYVPQLKKNINHGQANHCMFSMTAIPPLSAAHVPILAGTDAGNPGTAPGASLHGELEYLVEAGLTPQQALVAATSAPATAFHLADRGRIAPGLRADLLLVNGDPTADIKATRDILAIWKTAASVDRQAWLQRVKAASDSGVSVARSAMR